MADDERPAGPSLWQRWVARPAIPTTIGLVVVVVAVAGYLLVRDAQPVTDDPPAALVEGDQAAEESTASASEIDGASQTDSSDASEASAEPTPLDLPSIFDVLNRCTPASELAVSSQEAEGGPAKNITSFCLELPLQAQEVGGDDPLLQLHTNRDDLYLAFEAYTEYGSSWTGQAGTFPLECGEPWGLCLILDLDGAGPLEPFTWLTGGEVSILPDPFTVCLHGGHEFEDPATDTVFRIEQDLIMAPWVDEEIFDGFESCSTSSWTPVGQ